MAFLVVLAAVALGLRAGVTRARRGATWDCGYARPTTRMQDTGASFGDWIAGRLTPKGAAPAVEVAPPEGRFPRGARLALAASRDPLVRVLEPLAGRIARRFSALHALQEGRLAIYLVYVLGTLVALLAWSAFRGGVPLR